jgi:hypothetical protein
VTYINRPSGEAARGQLWRYQMDIATIAVIIVVLVSYLVGSLTSSVETEKELPHRY